MTVWTWAGASSRGTSHIQAGTRKQDAYAAFTCCEGAVLVALVSDGAGSASHGGEGASLTCRMLASCIRRHYQQSVALPTDQQIRDWLDAIRDRIMLAAHKRGKRSRDFAATLVLLITDGTLTLTAHVGDGSAVTRSSDLQAWQAVSWPAQGEYASTTFFVTDDPEPLLKISRVDQRIDALAVFTDGIERLALDFSRSEAHQPFFTGIIRPLETTPARGRDFGLSAKLNQYLSGPAINARTDDDKTLVLAIRR